MPPEGRESLVQALLNQLPEQSSPAVIVVRPDRPTPAPIRANGHRSNPPSPTYDPSLVFVLELITILSTRDQESVRLMGPNVLDALNTIVRDAANVHPLILSRAVFYLLHLLNAAQVSGISLVVVSTKCYSGSQFRSSTCNSTHHRWVRPNNV